MSAVPRPRVTAPTPLHIREEQAARVLWGDEVAGDTLDWIYISGDKVHQMVWSMPPGGVYRQSERNPTVVAADMIYHVLDGTLVVNNPGSGEVHRVSKGETIICPRGTWNYGFRYCVEELRVLELSAPPPGTWSSDPIMATKLEHPRYFQDEWIGRWPAPTSEAGPEFTMRVVRERDVLWRLEGRSQQMLVGIVASTAKLTFGQIHLLPGQRSDVHAHGGDEVMYMVNGRMVVRADAEPKWSELKPRDAFYIPEGVRHEYYNYSDRPVIATFLVAPRYLPAETD